MVMEWILAVIAVVFLLFVLAGTVMVAAAFKKNIIAEEILLDSLPEPFDGYRILFITDIHRRRLPKDLLEPYKGRVDAVFLGGDMTEKGNKVERLADNMAFLASLAPVYAVHGNHDYRTNITLADNIIRGSGARLLVDENAVIERDGATLLLTGVDFPKKGGKKAYAPLPPVSPQEALLFRIILVHDPLWLSQQKTLPADLVLAGHTHGGQVVLPFGISMHADPFYKRYNAGHYNYAKGDGSGAQAKLLISRGFGTAHLPVRWRSPSEMHVLTLRRGQDGSARPDPWH
ncbi:metallophosphoesterase [Paenibacillus sp. PK3_47]|uniref:metallophosphoesterase n=1 Tax=Paenibacillus sp. PK3_47 TaxID=2072642 RepID=UPI00201E2D0C|nr:metallophosphoesterase [Paenibacillus sp. PK3_47]